MESEKVVISQPIEVESVRPTRLLAGSYVFTPGTVLDRKTGEEMRDGGQLVNARNNVATPLTEDDVEALRASPHVLWR